MTLTDHTHAAQDVLRALEAALADAEQHTGRSLAEPRRQVLMLRAHLGAIEEAAKQTERALRWDEHAETLLDLLGRVLSSPVLGWGLRADPERRRQWRATRAALMARRAQVRGRR